MNNGVYLIGRLSEDLKIETRIDGKEITNITLAVPRPYKNSDGVYDTDYIKCILQKGIAVSAIEHCHIGDVVGIRGRIQVNDIDENGNTNPKNIIIAEKIMFLSNKSEEKD